MGAGAGKEAIFQLPQFACRKRRATGFRAGQAQGQIGLTPRQVHGAGIGQQAEPQMRVARAQPRQGREQEVVHHERNGGDAHGAPDRAGKRGMIVCHRKDAGLGGLGAGQHARAQFGQPASLRRPGAGHQRRAKVAGDGPDPPRHGGFIDAKLSRRPGKGSGAGIG